METNVREKTSAKRKKRSQGANTSAKLWGGPWSTQVSPANPPGASIRMVTKITITWGLGPIFRAILSSYSMVKSFNPHVFLMAFFTTKNPHKMGSFKPVEQCEEQDSQWMIAIPNRKKVYHLVMTFAVCHGKIHHAIKFGKPSISIRAIEKTWLWGSFLPPIPSQWTSWLIAIPDIPHFLDYKTFGKKAGRLNGHFKNWEQLEVPIPYKRPIFQALISGDIAPIHMVPEIWYVYVPPLIQILEISHWSTNSGKDHG